MSEAVIVALITGAISLAGIVASSIITSRISGRDVDHKLEVNHAVLNTRLEALTDEVRKHNNVIERVYALERDNTVQNEKIAVANHRITDIEKEIAKYHHG